MIIWLASYPRSGNTYIRTILKHAFSMNTYSIYGDKFDIGADRDTAEIVGHSELPENFDYQEARKSKDPFFIKTHELYSDKYKDDKFIYLVRDGREATVSLFYYLRKYTNINYSFLEIMNGFPQFAESWSEHVSSWKPKNKENALLIKFEEAVSEPKNIIDRIQSFLNLDLIGLDVPSFEKLNSTNPKFFRSGKKDSYLAELSEYERKYFWLINGRVMEDYGYTEQTIYKSDNQENIEFMIKHVSLSNKKYYERLKRDLNNFVERANDLDQKLYQASQLNIKKDVEITRITMSFSYRIGKLITLPLRFFLDFLKINNKF